MIKNNNDESRSYFDIVVGVSLTEHPISNMQHNLAHGICILKNLVFVIFADRNMPVHH